MNQKKSLVYHLVGWTMFILCSIFFIISSVRNEDILSLIASCIFFLACFVFLIPLIADVMHLKRAEKE